MNFKIAALIAAAVVASSLPVVTASAGTLPLVTRANEDAEIWRSKKNVFVLEIDKDKPCSSCAQTESVLADHAAKHPALKFVKTYCGETLGCTNGTVPAKALVWLYRQNYFYGDWGFSQNDFQIDESNVDAFLDAREKFVKTYDSLAADISILQKQIRAIDDGFADRQRKVNRAGDCSSDVFPLTNAQREMGDAIASNDDDKYKKALKQFQESSDAIALKSKTYQQEMEAIRADMAVALGDLPRKLKDKQAESDRLVLAEWPNRWK